MMSLADIHEQSRQAAREAQREQRLPCVLEQEDIDRINDTGDYYGVTIPTLGNYVPKGWRRTEREELFVDSSGFGSEGEPALTIEQFFKAVIPGKGYAVTEAGQFQVYVAEYEMIPTSKRRTTK